VFFFFLANSFVVFREIFVLKSGESEGFAGFKTRADQLLSLIIGVKLTHLIKISTKVLFFVTIIML